MKFEVGAASHFLPDKGGPVPGWKAAGFAPTQEYFGNPSGSLPAEGHPEIALNIDDVLKYKDQPGYALVDARPINEYEGHGEIWLRKGHIPGAISFHWARLMEKDITYKFKPYAETKLRSKPPASPRTRTSSATAARRAKAASCAFT